MYNNSSDSSVTDSLLLCTKSDVQSYTLIDKEPIKTPSITAHSTGSEGLSSSSACLLSSNSGGDEDLSEATSVKSLDRHLTLFDLISIGVAATVGSGIFVLCGLIAHDYAGPSTFICWAIAGASCFASGLCYAELSGKFAVSGSTYTYVVSGSCDMIIVLIVESLCEIFSIYFSPTNILFPNSVTANNNGKTTSPCCRSMYYIRIYHRLKCSCPVLGRQSHDIHFNLLQQ